MLERTEVKILNADPSAMGLFGLAIVTLVASSQKLGITSGTSLIVPWAVFLGAFAQLFACIHDAKSQNVFGATAFGGYAFFWFSMAVSWMIQNGVFGSGMAAAADGKQMAFAFLGYLIFSIFMTIAAIETNKVLLIIFIFIDCLFLGLTCSTFGIMAHGMHTFAAISELAIAIASFYGFGANILNSHLGYSLLPLGKPLNILRKE